MRHLREIIPNPDDPRDFAELVVLELLDMLMPALGDNHDTDFRVRRAHEYLRDVCGTTWKHWRDRELEDKE